VGGAEDASEQLRLLAPLGLVLTTGLGLTISALAAARLRRDQVRDAVLRENAQAAKLRFEAVRVEPTSGRLVGVPKLPLAALVASGIGLFALVVAMAIVVVTVEMDATVLDDALSEESAASVDGSTIGGLLVMAGLAADAVAFVLAVTALLVERRWRPASIVALIGSVLPLGAVVVLLLLGLLAALVG